MKKPESLKAWCLLGAVSCLSACTDLNVPQANEPDSERVLSNSGDVVPLFAGSFNTWFNGVYAAQGPYAVLNNMTFQNNGPWANNGADLYGRIPRVGVINDIAAHYYSNIVRVWYWAYRANASVSDGFRALSNPTISEDFSTEELAQLRAYGKFVQGMAHATVALFYDRGFIIDETTDPGLPHEPVDYPELMEAAFRKFDEAIDVAETSEFTLPFSWMQADLSSRDLVRVINSYKARFRSQVARTKEERGSLDWSAVLNDVETGIQSDFEISMDWNAGWYNQALDFTPYTSGNSFTYFMYGMSDQGGNVAEWLDLNLAEKSSLLPDGRPVLIVTPDLRFPQGVTVEEQRAAPGTYFRIMDPDEVGNTWKAPQRGTWRWSWYKAGHEKFQSYWLLEKFDQPEILLGPVNTMVKMVYLGHGNHRSPIPSHRKLPATSAGQCEYLQPQRAQRHFVCC